MDNLKKLIVCVIRNDRMGDMILTLPISESYKRKLS